MAVYASKELPEIFKGTLIEDLSCRYGYISVISVEAFEKMKRNKDPLVSYYEENYISVPPDFKWMVMDV